MNVVSRTDVIFFAFAVLLTFFLLVLLFWFSYWYQEKRNCVSPYSGQPLRRASDLPYASKLKIYRMLYERHEYDNRLFDLNRAAVCRETGRVFFEAVKWFDRIDVDWNFLKKRYPGNYVSWGSLSEAQKAVVRAAHPSLEGFQTEHSSPLSAPRMVEPEYAFDVPGPLYVDIESKILVGWQVVPETNFEILIVQKPTN